MQRFFLPCLIAAGACVVTACAAPAAAARLDGLLVFDDPANCGLGKPFATLVGSLLKLDASGEEFTLGEPRVPARYRRLIGRPQLQPGHEGSVTVTTPLSGTWRGLKVTALVHTAKAETDWWVVSIRFAEPRAKVLQAANAAGLALPPSGRRVSEGELDMTIGVAGDERQAELYCAT